LADLRLRAATPSSINWETAGLINSDWSCAVLIENGRQPAVRTQRERSALATSRLDRPAIATYADARGRNGRLADAGRDHQASKSRGPDPSPYGTACPNPYVRENGSAVHHASMNRSSFRLNDSPSNHQSHCAVCHPSCSAYFHLSDYSKYQ